MPIGRIQLKHGLESSADFNTMLQAEAYYATDTKRLMISHGDGTGAIMPSKDEVDAIQTGIVDVAILAEDELPETALPRDADTLAGQDDLYYAKQADLDTLENNINLVQSNTESKICKLLRSVPQSIPNTTVTQILFNSTEIDNDGTMADIVNGRIYCRKAGIYVISAHLFYAPNATGVRNVYVGKNGSLITSGSIGTMAGNTLGTNIVQAFVVAELQVNDYITISGYQSSGGALDVQGGTDRTDFAIYRIG